MTHASLFSGIGGFDLAAEWAGWTNVFNCEIDKFCQKVLRYHFPNAIQYEDIKSTDFAIHRGGVDVLTGGFPCQPFSLAGKRRGSDDNRYLWPEMLRAIREIQPRWVVGENVFGIVNWSDGMVFEQVQSDLEAEGYEVQPFLIPACAVDAPHRRDRVWFIARKRTVADCCNAGVEVLQREGSIGLSAERDVTNADSAGFSTCVAGQTEIQSRRGDSRVLRRRYFEGFPTQSPVCGRDDGLSARLDACSIPGWLRGGRRFRFSGYWRRESIKAYGNAVVPQVVLQIFETINEYEIIITSQD